MEGEGTEEDREKERYNGTVEYTDREIEGKTKRK